ncbi:predicted protein [Sclerotinia sclerotiorum 1980 UF-70]|uniref:Uncharacterized protein n=1 Tax=Sclerotinia sclerotiorum (strain ATCC 18683 / 1980 / Ss-1) TaxID=665079 RepID=A7EZ27_SCLS1|nr:predicted protein [Sclerotinia sclerotiorum 1980 UF-70]EDN94719.1 predicted protein [Sclerotinia sclerotiorum 1980 UF-70]
MHRTEDGQLSAESPKLLRAGVRLRCTKYKVQSYECETGGRPPKKAEKRQRGWVWAVHRITSVCIEA